MVLCAFGPASFEHPFDLGLLRIAELDLLERRYQKHPAWRGVMAAEMRLLGLAGNFIVR